VILTGTEARGIALMLASYQGFLESAIRDALVCGKEPTARAVRKLVAIDRGQWEKAEKFRKGLVG
jgi:hypothetical protein